MLPAWYFCCCIGTDANRTSAYLGILQTLDSEIDDDRLLRSAYKELARTETWMRIYAYPAILDTVRRRAEVASWPCNSGYFETLLSSLSDDLEPRLRAAMDDALQYSDTTSVLEHLTLSVEAVLGAGGRATRRVSPVPYLDVQEFLPETICLGLLDFVLTDSIDARAHLEGWLSEGRAVALEELVRKALDGSFGRLSQTLSFPIALKLPGRFDAELLLNGLVASNPSIYVEPDLLEIAALLHANYQYRDMSADDLDSTLRSVIEETVATNRLRQIINQKTVARQGELISDALNRIGVIAPSHQGIQSLSLIYWQAALWRIAFQISCDQQQPESFAQLIESSWQPYDPPGNLTLQLSGQPSTLREWQGDLDALGRLHGTQLRFTIARGRTLLTDSIFSLASPWFSVDPANFQWRSGLDRPPRYPRSTSSQAMLRLMVAAIEAATLLRLLPSSAEARPNLAALIVHAHDVLTHAHVGPKDNTDPLVPEQHVGLGRFALRQTQACGRAMWPSISPEDFLHLGQIAATRRWNLPRGFHRILASTMVSWLQDSYNSATTNSPAARWINYIEPLYNTFNQFPMSEHEPFTRQLMALLGRFICPAPIPLDLSRMGLELDLGRVKPGQLRGRTLLLTDHQPPELWTMAEWNLHLETPGRYQSQLPVPLAIQKFASIARNPNLTDEQRHLWHEEWVAALKGLNDPIDLDRFVRIRLIELLDSPSVADSSEDQLLIALTILRFGTAYDLSRLFSVIFPVGADGKLSSAPVARKSTREALARAMLRIFRQKPENTEGSQTPYDPRFIFEWQRLATIETWLMLISLAEESGSKLNRSLLDLSAKLLNDLLDSTLQSITCSISSEGWRSQLIPSDDLNMPLGVIFAGAFNHNTDAAHLVVAEVATQGVVDLLTMSRDEKEKWFTSTDDGDLLMLGIATEVTPTLQRFNVGFRRTIQHSGPSAVDLKIGDLVRLRVEKQRDQLRNPRALSIATPRSNAKGPCFVRLKEESRSNPPGSTLALLIDDRPVHRFDSRLWDADLTRRFRGDLMTDYRVPATRDSSGTPIPIERDLLDLVLECRRTLNKTHITLTLVEVRGTRGYLFSSHPGNNFFISSDQFIASDAAELQRVVGVFHDPCGLLITLTPTVDNHETKLRLVTDSVDDTAWPELQVPFDVRSISWLDTFGQTQTRIAQLNPGALSQCTIYLAEPIPSFPSSVTVELQGQRPISTDHIEVTTEPWTPRLARLGRVMGSAFKTHTAEPQDDLAFANDWLKLRQGHILTLDSVLKDGSGIGGWCLCNTKDGVPVYVESESLTMLSLGDRTQRLNVRGRPAYIARSVNLQNTDVLIQESPPASMVKGNRCEGILIQIPQRDETNATAYTVLWSNGHAATRQTITLRDLDKFKPILGARVIGLNSSTGWTYKVVTPRFTVRALWQLDRHSAPNGSSHFLGHTSFEGQRLAVFETSPGRLVLHHAIDPEPAHQTIWNDVTLSGSRRKSIPVKASQPSTYTWPEGGIRYRRCLVRLKQSAGVLVGDCRSTDPNGDVVLSGVDVRIAPLAIAGHSDMMVVRRNFRLAEPMPTTAPVNPVNTNELYRQQLESYLASPTALRGTFDQQGHVLLHSFRIPSAENPNYWTNRVELGADQGAHIADARYLQHCDVHLIEDVDGHYVASFRQVPSMTPEQYMQQIGEPFDQEVSPIGSLTYVGPVPPLASTDQTLERQHLFEWGYGKTLLVPESRLLLNGAPFSERAQLLLYHGDIVQQIAFRGMPSPESPSAPISVDDDSADSIISYPTCSIDILEFRYSHGRTLYIQATQYKMVHRLHLSISTDGITVRSIEGFDDRTDSPVMRFDRVRSEVTEQSRRRLQARLEGAGRLASNSDLVSYTILGKLDTETFSNSLGRIVRFEHTRLSFHPNRDFPGLTNGDLVFLQAGRIETRRNDFALELQAPDDLDSLDIGEDFRSSGNRRLSILRRNFSVRQDALRQVLGSGRQNTSALLRSIIPVRLSRPRDFVVAALVWGFQPQVPFRSLTALSSRSTLATVIRPPDENALRMELELKPGVFIRLDSTHLSEIPDHLDRGSTVKIERVDGRIQKFTVKLAIPGDSRYISSEPRPAVALPMNMLLRRQEINQGTSDIEANQFWQRKCFTIGGLPGIVATPGAFDQSRRLWSPPMATSFVSLMRTHHPKIAYTAVDEMGVPRLAPAPSTTIVGRLEPTGDNARARFVPHPGFESIPACELDWLSLSFADKPAVSLARMLQSRSWAYHDDFTGHWTSALDVVSEKIDEVSGSTGPLFFETQNGLPRLRFSTSAFLTYGSSTEELINFLRSSKQSTVQVTVAGLSDIGGLWLELAPGRIVEMPSSIVYAKPVPSRELPMEQFAWTLVAPGDQVRISLAGDPLTVNRMILEKWIPGPRGSFGPGSVFLPIVSIDATRGGLLLGAGDYQLTLPTAAVPDTWSSVILDQNNRLRDANGRLPYQGDVVLLGLASERACVLGMPHLTPIAHRGMADWEDDPLYEVLMPNSNVALQALETLISAAGGALPVTVQHVTREGVLYFTRKHQAQNNTMRPGQIVQGTVTGLLNQYTVLVRLGGGLVTAALSDIVSGLPPANATQAIEILRQSADHHWFRVNERGKLELGIDVEMTLEPRVEVLDVITSAQTTASGVITGAICKSVETQRLYWLDSSRAGWADLDPINFRRLFGPKSRSGIRSDFRARLVHNRRTTKELSLVELRSVHHDFSQLDIGRELSVQIVGETANVSGEIDERRWIGQARGSTMAIEIATYGEEELYQGAVIAVEVIRKRIDGYLPRLLVVPNGKRRFTLDLPAWMRSGIPDSGVVTSPEMTHYLINRQCEDRPWREVDDFNVKTLDDETLTKLLCSAYSLISESTVHPADLQNQAAIARAWRERFTEKVEMLAAYGIMVVLLLDHAGTSIFRANRNRPTELSRQYQHDARRFLHHLGQRALRSMHCEVLARYWLENPQYRIPGQNGILRRLRIASNNLKTPLGFDKLQALEDLSQSIYLYSDDLSYLDLLPVADGISASLGILPDPLRLGKNAPVTGALVLLARCLPELGSMSPAYLEENQIRILKSLLDRLDQKPVDVTLLSPLPPVMNSKGERANLI